MSPELPTRLTPADIIRNSIVLVHGLQGHPKKTWAFTTPGSAQGTSHRKSRLLRLVRSSRSKPETDQEEEDGKVVFWPEDLLPKDCPTTKIWTLGYDSRVSRFFSGAANQSTLGTCCMCDVANFFFADNIFGHAKNLLYELNREIDTSVNFVERLVQCSVLRTIRDLRLDRNSSLSPIRSVESL